MAKVIDGKAIARALLDELHQEIGGRKPGITMVLVGSNPASEAYVNTKSRAAKSIGMISTVLRLPKDLSEKELLTQIENLNQNKEVDGILVQLPLPQKINPQAVMLAIAPHKDVDGFHPINMGKLLLGEKDGFIPCTPHGIFRVLQIMKVDLSGKRVVILGRSNIVGKPLAALLLQKRAGCNATVTIAHSKTKHLPSLCQEADVLIAAIGRPRFVDATFVKEGAVVIDVGINRVDDASAKKGYRLVGDVDFDSVEKKCAMITPVPGGVGPMTVAMLLANTWQSYSSSSAAKSR